MRAENGTKHRRKTTKRGKRNVWKDAADMLEAVLISIFCVIMLFAHVLRPVTVEGHSMESTLQDQDKLFMTDLFYTPERGDIVIIDNDASHTLMKTAIWLRDRDFHSHHRKAFD